MAKPLILGYNNIVNIETPRAKRCLAEIDEFTYKFNLNDLNQQATYEAWACGNSFFDIKGDKSNIDSLYNIPLGSITQINRESDGTVVNYTQQLGHQIKTLDTTQVAHLKINPKNGSAFGEMLGQPMERKGLGSTIDTTSKKWITANAGVLDANGLITFVSDDVNGDYLLVGTDGAGDYQIIVTCDQTNSGNNTTSLEVHINGAVVTDIESEHDSNSIKPSELSAHGIHALADGDKVTLHLESSVSANIVKVYDCHVTIQRIS